MPLTPPSQIERLRADLVRGDRLPSGAGTCLTDMRISEMLSAFHNILHRACHLDRFKNGAFVNRITLVTPLTTCFQVLKENRADLLSAEQEALFRDGLVFVRGWTGRRGTYVTKPYELIATLGSFPADIKRIFNDDNVAKGRLATFRLHARQEIGRPDTRRLGFHRRDLICPSLGDVISAETDGEGFVGLGHLVKPEGGAVLAEGVGGEIIFPMLGTRRATSVGGILCMVPSQRYLLTDSERSLVRTGRTLESVRYFYDGEEEDGYQHKGEEEESDSEKDGEDGNGGGGENEDEGEDEDHEGEDESEDEVEIMEKGDDQGGMHDSTGDGLEQKAKRWLDTL